MSYLFSLSNFLTDKQETRNRDVVLQKDGKNTVNRTYEQRRTYKVNVNLDRMYTYNQKKQLIFYEERRLEK